MDEFTKRVAVNAPVIYKTREGESCQGQMVGYDQGSQRAVSRRIRRGV